MNRYAILSAFAVDQVGLIAKITEVLATSQCNIEDSKISRLGQALGMMLLLKLPDGLNPDDLLHRFAALKNDLSLQITIEEIQPHCVIETPPIKPLAHLTCHGADRIGLVHTVTKFLADQSINIIDMQTNTLRLAQPEYIMELTLEIPTFVDLPKLSQQLKELSGKLGADIFLRP
jgi:glycine cleavage system regulatory protein